MAARFVFIVASLCYVAILVQDSTGSCIRSGGLPNNMQISVGGERYAPESSLDCSPISRNSVRDPYESSYDDDPSQIDRRQMSCSCDENEMAVAAIPRRQCPMHNYVLQETPEPDSEPCKAYGVMVAAPKPTPKASFVSTSHKYQVEKIKEQRRDMMEQRRAYGFAVSVPRAPVRSPSPEVAYDYKVETPKKAKVENRNAYGVAVVRIPEPEPCLPCMEDDNIPDEGFHEPPGPCYPCVDNEPESFVQEPQPVSLPRSGGCKSCATSRGTQAGGYYYKDSRRKSSSSSSSRQSYEQRYEGRRDSQAVSHVSFVSLQSVGDLSKSGGTRHSELPEDYYSGVNDDLMDGEEGRSSDYQREDAEYGREDSHSMKFMGRSYDSEEEGGESELSMECDSMSDDNKESEGNSGSAYEIPRSKTKNVCRPSNYFQDASDEEDDENTSGQSSMEHSSFGYNVCASNIDKEGHQFESLQSGSTISEDFDTVW